ncbi:class II aldolase/adducin family protein [bacterium]|nr:class II aldolase/adducin family protein [bacterium]
MKKVITLNVVEEMARRGECLSNLPAGAVVTPSAKDFIKSQKGRTTSAKPTSNNNFGLSITEPAVKLNSKSPISDLEALYTSPWCEDLKRQLVDMGRRLWERAYVDGNGGNIAIKVGDDIALCTPTLVSKGFMAPEDMCLVDFEGNQIFGRKKRTSEILMHLQIMKAQPRAVATCHCHPPYATGFAVAGVEPPTCMIPEFEVFASVATAEYRTPGTPEMGKLVADLSEKHNTILMANHGVVSWSHNSVEDAYFKMEILEAYCRTVLVTAQLGKKPNQISPTQLKDLLNIKESLGIPDPRMDLKECELCDNSDWRPGVSCEIPPKDDASGIAENPDAEDLVKAITDQIMQKLRG